MPNAKSGGHPADATRWAGRWSHADAVAAEAIASVLAGHAEPTEPAIARDVVRALPDGAALVVSSSMPVRDVEWFSAPRDDLPVFANRGANGIDGVVSTAVGVAVCRPPSGRSAGQRTVAGVDTGPTALLIGDVAFLHDTQRPARRGPARHRPHGRGGRQRRWRHLLVPAPGRHRSAPSPSSSCSARLTASTWPGLAAAHGVSGRRARRARPRSARPWPSRSPWEASTCIVVPTDRAANVAVHREIDAAVAAALTT